VLLGRRKNQKKVCGQASSWWDDDHDLSFVPYKTMRDFVIKFSSGFALQEDDDDAYNDDDGDKGDHIIDW